MHASPEPQQPVFPCSQLPFAGPQNKKIAFLLSHTLLAPSMPLVLPRFWVLPNTYRCYRGDSCFQCLIPELPPPPGIPVQKGSIGREWRSVSLKSIFPSTADKVQTNLTIQLSLSITLAVTLHRIDWKYFPLTLPEIKMLPSYCITEALHIPENMCVHSIQCSGDSIVFNAVQMSS